MADEVHGVLQDIMSGAHSFDPLELQALQGEELENLEGMVSGRYESGNRVRAMAALTTAAGARGALDALGAVLGNENEESPIRAAAALNLGQTRSTLAETTLLEQLPRAAEGIVRQSVVKALGMIGSEDSLRRLAELSRDDDPVVRRQARFGCSLIAHRSGQAGWEPPIPSSTQILNLEAGNVGTFYVRSASSSEVAAIVGSLGNRTYSLTLSTSSGYLIECGQSRMVLLLNEDVLKEDLASSLAKQRSIAGVVVVRAPVDGSYSIRWIVFTWPSEDDRFLIAVHRTNGSQVFFGSALLSEGGADFQIASVSGLGNSPASVRGRIQGLSIALTEALTSQGISRQLRPRRISLPDLDDE